MQHLKAFILCVCICTFNLKASGGPGSNGGNGGDLLALKFSQVSWTVYHELQTLVRTSPHGGPFESLLPRLYHEISTRTVYSSTSLSREQEARWGQHVVKLLTASPVPSNALVYTNWSHPKEIPTHLTMIFRPDLAQGVGIIEVDLQSGEGTVSIGQDLNDAVRSGTKFRTACSVDKVLQCKAPADATLSAEFTLQPGVEPFVVQNLTLTRQEPYLLLSAAYWKAYFEGPTSVASFTKRRVLEMYLKILGISDPELPYKYQSFPRIGQRVIAAPGSELAWQREHDLSIFSMYAWNNERPRHLPPQTVVRGTLKSMTFTDVAIFAEIIPDDAIRSQGVWTILRTNSRAPYYQLKDKLMWVFWKDESLALPRYMNLKDPRGQVVPSLQMGKDRGLVFTLPDVKPLLD